MHRDKIGIRMKRYEAVSSGLLTPKMPIVIRVDGRAFHTLLKHAKKPFDGAFMTAMEAAAINTAREIAGFTMAYTQSDECSFYIRDTQHLETQQWFNGEINKLVSITASMFTCHFDNPAVLPAYFDARAFSIPRDDLPNYFYWRHRDWNRNSLSMLAQAHFTHRELMGKGRAEMHEMLHSLGVNWTELAPEEKDGAYFGAGSRRFVISDPSYESLDALINQCEDLAP